MDEVLSNKDYVSEGDLEKLEYTEQVLFYYSIYGLSINAT